MNIIRKFATVLGRYGVRGALFRAHVFLTDQWFDFRYGVDTCGQIPLSQLSVLGNNRAQGHRYEPARVLILRRLFTQMEGLLPKPWLVVDLGSGKGRVLLVAAESGARRATGIEFATELCRQSRKNFLRFMQRTGTYTELVVIESDVTDYKVSAEDNIFIMFNPFDPVVSQTVMNNIGSSLRQTPRQILICLYNTSPELLINMIAEVKLTKELNYSGYSCLIYSNK